MNHERHIPVPTSCQRDADGRLTGLVIDSEPPLAVPETNPWLVAVDGSDNALRAVAHAVRQADAMHACALHLVNVQHWLGKEAAEAELAHRSWLATETARALLDAKGHPWRLHVAMGEPPNRSWCWPGIWAAPALSSATVASASSRICYLARSLTSSCT